MIEAAKTGRSSCRTCREKIAKGELRFGIVDYTFSSDGSFKWHHLTCAAKKQPEALKEAIEAHEGELPDREGLLAACAEGKKGTAFPRAELAPSGRAKCLKCEEKIGKGDLRVVVQRMVEALGQARPAYLHPGCAKGAEQLEEVDDLSATLRENSALTDEQLDELDALLSA